MREVSDARDAAQDFLTMPAIAPIRASVREPKRERPIPRAVRAAVLAMIYGDPAAGDDAPPLSFVQAAKIAQIQSYVLRRWLDKPAVIQLIRRERALFRRALCCGNEGALARIRDHGANAAASVRAALALEQIDAVDSINSRTDGSTPGVTIHIIAAPKPSPEAVIDVTPVETAEPVFDPYRR
jgi:hypothetical protein